MVVAGITSVIPWLGWPGVIWTLIAVVVAGYNTYSFICGGFVVARRRSGDDGQAEGI